MPAPAIARCTCRPTCHTLAPHSTVEASASVTKLALSVLQPGFVASQSSEWSLCTVHDRPPSVVLFTRNIASAERVVRLTAQLRAGNRSP